MIKVSKFDVAEYLNNPEIIAAYLTEAFATKDQAFIMVAIGDVARAKGMSDVAKETGLSRESLYKSLSGDTKPEFDTVQKVLSSFGLKMIVEPADESAKAA
jgi:probable addiction module antidote protein